MIVWDWNGAMPRGGTASSPGTGTQHVTTIENYVAFLKKSSERTREKQRGGVVSLAVSRYRGRSDDECEARTGVLLDSDDCDGWDEVRALFRDVGLAFVAQRRLPKPSNHHIEMFFAKPLVPVRERDGSVHAWKEQVYRPRLGWLLGVVSELAKLRCELAYFGGQPSAKHAGYDPMCDQLLQANCIYTRRPGDPQNVFPETDYELGHGLDLDVFIERSGFEMVPVRATTIRAGSTRASLPNVFVPSLASEDVGIYALVERLMRLSKPESRDLFAPVLAGMSYAPIGARDNTLYRIACVLAYLSPRGSAIQLAEVLRASLRRMADEPGAEPNIGYVEAMLALAAKKIEKVQRRIAAGGGL